MNKIIRIIIFVIAISLMSFSGYKLYGIYKEYKTGSDLYNSLANQFVTIKESAKKEESVTVNSSDEEPSLNLDKTEDEIKIDIDFDTLLETNKDIVAWIYSPDTPINYPVVQSNDNDYYLRRMLDGTHNTAGTIFMDYRNNKDLSDLNTIIYGHNMKNNSMFGTLDKYKSQEYYDEHPLIYLITKDKTLKIELLAGLIVSETSEVYRILRMKKNYKAFIIKC